MTRISELPEEMGEEIMSWLPPESLMQIKCVKKSWNILINNLIIDTRFVAKHLQNSYNNKNSATTSFVFRLLSLSNGSRQCDKSHYVLTLNEANSEFSIKDISFMANWKILSGYHCNGVIFLLNRKRDKVLLHNPAISETKILRNSCFEERFSTLALGFGHDSITNTYKIVRIARQRKNGRCGAEVCVLGINLGKDLWREIELPIEIKNGPNIGQDLFFEGVFYWLVSDFAKREMILSFEVNTEEFKVMDLPAEIRRDDDSPSLIGWHLTIWKERVILLMCPSEYSVPKPIEMWIMVKLNESCQSWKKHLTIFVPSCLSLCPLAFTNSDRLLMVDEKEGVILYNPGIREFAKLEILEGVDAVHAFVYVKSLVSLNRMIHG